MAGRRGELSGASHYLSHLRWPWLLAAVAVELGSFVAFALVQRRLLWAGGVDMSLGRLTAVTLASTAIANSMPAGPLVSSVFAFRQYRRRGADAGPGRMDARGGVRDRASVSLAVVAAAVLAIAGAEGAGLDLIGVTVGVLVLALVLGCPVRPAPRRRLGGDGHRPDEPALPALAGRRHRGPDREHRRPVDHRHPLGRRAFARWPDGRLANWVLDCGCLALSFVALGVGVPWKGLLLAYGAGQLAANLPITPGGLGVVEGSLTIALVAFGGSETSTVAVVLLYRILSFWTGAPGGLGGMGRLSCGSIVAPGSGPPALSEPEWVEVRP